MRKVGILLVREGGLLSVGLRFSMLCALPLQTIESAMLHNASKMEGSTVQLQRFCMVCGSVQLMRGRTSNKLRISCLLFSITQHQHHNTYLTIYPTSRHSAISLANICSSQFCNVLTIIVGVEGLLRISCQRGRSLMRTKAEAPRQNF